MTMSAWTQADRAAADAQHADNLTRRCPRCGARPGEPCVTDRGTRMQTTHYARDDV